MRDGTLEVRRVSLGSRAAELGLQAGDRIVEINGATVASYGGGEKLISKLTDRDLKTVVFKREGRRFDVTF
ncbi:MAG: hypothetical protein GKS06_19940 [Acidobacteria bacterium]|nr:hypothetical protein [Acidobacteriota bacterium]